MKNSEASGCFTATYVFVELTASCSANAGFILERCLSGTFSDEMVRYNYTNVQAKPLPMINR